MVVSELRGEKIDIIPYNEEPARFVAKALSPARVREVLVDDEERQATVIVPDDQLSLAIGREGQNARLAAKLTGWRVDIVGESEFAERGEEEGFDEDEEEAFDGRCSAVLSAGRRCPNAALAGHRGTADCPRTRRWRASRPTRSPCSRSLGDDEIARSRRAAIRPTATSRPIVARAEEAFARPSEDEPAEPEADAEEPSEGGEAADAEAEDRAEEARSRRRSRDEEVAAETDDAEPESEAPSEEP